MQFKAGCKTTAMGIMPHRDVGRALELAFSLDIPFWPQLPNLSFYEDMYVQASEHFPGISVDLELKQLTFDSQRFEEELPDYSERMALPETFAISEGYSEVYHRFLTADLGGYPAVRGQCIGPVSFGFRVIDENKSPIIYNDELKTLLFDFIRRKINHQHQELSKRNANAFVWLDEPGLGWVFSGLSGYHDVQARQDYLAFLEGLTGLKALHLCANVNLPYLLGMGTELISFDAYQLEVMPRAYAEAVADFVREGGVISWGIVPMDSETLHRETPERLASLLIGYWEVVSKVSRLPLRQLAEAALLAPARCCLKNLGRVGASDEAAGNGSGQTPKPLAAEQVVEEAFAYLRAVAAILKNRFNL